MRCEVFAAFALLAIGGAAQAASSACLLHSEHPMVEAQLFFGREIDNRGPVTEKEWSDFVSGVIANDFPDGFTVTNGEGAWLDPKSKAAVHEDSKIVLIAAKQSPNLAAKLAHVMDAYKTQFRQHSVGLITRQVCAAF
jgi:hypothetical protein